MFKQKLDEEKQNARLTEEIQNLRFMLQDKESVIKRLEFKLDREKEDRGMSNAKNF